MGRKSVLLLGDSIMYGAKGLHGYGYYVREAMKDRFDVYLPNDNCQNNRYMNRFANELIPLSEKGFDAVNWNNGLWDVLHFCGNPDPYTKAELYREYPEKFFDYLKSHYPQAMICFAFSTPVAEHLQRTTSYRRNAEIEAYNAMACRALSGKVDSFDDLYSAASELGDEYRSQDGLHYSEDGARCLAGSVCSYLDGLLN